MPQARAQMEPATEFVAGARQQDQATGKGGQAAGAVAIDRALSQPTSARDAAAQFVTAFRGAEAGVPMSKAAFRARVVAATSLTGGGAKTMLDKALAKIDDLPFYVSMQLTIHEMSVAADEQARGEDGLRRFKISFKANVIAKAGGIEVKNSTRSETGTLAVDPTSLRILAFELPFLDKLKGEASTLTQPKAPQAGA